MDLIYQSMRYFSHPTVKCLPQLLCNCYPVGSSVLSQLTVEVSALMFRPRHATHVSNFNIHRIKISSKSTTGAPSWTHLMPSTKMYFAATGRTGCGRFGNLMKDYRTLSLPCIVSNCIFFVKWNTIGRARLTCATNPSTNCKVVQALEVDPGLYQGISSGSLGGASL